MSWLASTRFLAAVTVLFLVGQPLVASAGCWQMTIAEQECLAGCPMAPESDSRAQSADPGCCEITSPSSARQPTAVSSPYAAGHGELEPQARLPLLERPAAPLLVGASPPRPASSSLTALYCTFLI